MILLLPKIFTSTNIKAKCREKRESAAVPVASSSGPCDQGHRISVDLPNSCDPSHRDSVDFR